MQKNLNNSLNKRYGIKNSKKLPKTVKNSIILAVLAIIITVIVIYASIYSNISYETDALNADENGITISFHINAPKGSSLKCAFEALDKNQNQIGFAISDISMPDNSSTQNLKIYIKTLKTPVSGKVKLCWSV